MTVIAFTIADTSPGGYDEALDLAGQLTATYERLGARSVALLRPEIGGSAHGEWIAVAEFADAEAYGRFVGDAVGDAEHQTVLRRLAMSDGPVQSSRRGLASEVEISRKRKSGRGPLVDVLARRIRPGGYDAAVAAAKATLTFVERHGAVHGRLLHLSHAGSASGLFVLTWEYPRPSSLAAVLDAWANDDASPSRAANDPDAPASDVFRCVYRALTGS